MKQLLSPRLLALGAVPGTTLALVGVARQPARRTRAPGALVALRKTALGTILVGDKRSGQTSGEGLDDF